jgi:hypothetical protein
VIVAREDGDDDEDDDVTTATFSVSLCPPSSLTHTRAHAHTHTHTQQAIWDNVTLHCIQETKDSSTSSDVSWTLSSLRQRPEQPPSFDRDECKSRCRYSQKCFSSCVLNPLPVVMWKSAAVTVIGVVQYSVQLTRRVSLELWRKERLRLPAGRHVTRFYWSFVMM